jgi:hypothetical protein
VDEELLKKQQAAYSVAGVDEEVTLCAMCAYACAQLAHIDTSCTCFKARK